jgi:hypothetical protein
VARSGSGPTFRVQVEAAWRAVHRKEKSGRGAIARGAEAALRSQGERQLSGEAGQPGGDVDLARPRSPQALEVDDRAERVAVLGREPPGAEADAFEKKGGSTAPNQPPLGLS